MLQKNRHLLRTYNKIYQAFIYAEQRISDFFVKIFHFGENFGGGLKKFGEEVEGPKK